LHCGLCCGPIGRGRQPRCQPNRRRFVILQEWCVLARLRVGPSYDQGVGVQENEQRSWKQVLADKMPSDWAQEIDLYESQLHLRKQGKIEEKVFAETRLRRGSYGQRYDNGQRNDGIAVRTLPYDDK